MCINGGFDASRKKGQMHGVINSADCEGFRKVFGIDQRTLLCNLPNTSQIQLPAGDASRIRILTFDTWCCEKQTGKRRQNDETAQVNISDVLTGNGKIA